ncbi:MAG: hypothetical protein AAFN27_20625 [Pseudomonadota bacterium]
MSAIATLNLFIRQAEALVPRASTASERTRQASRYKGMEGREIDRRGIHRLWFPPGFDILHRKDETIDDESMSFLHKPRERAFDGRIVAESR